MLLIHCPYCERDLPEVEFTGAGEAHVARPDMARADDEALRDYLFIRRNPKGIVLERWRHTHGCARFFNAARDSVSDRFLLTYKADEPAPDLDALMGVANENMTQPDLNEPARSLVEGMGGETESAITSTSRDGGSARSPVTGVNAEGGEPPEGRSLTDAARGGATDAARSGTADAALGGTTDAARGGEGA